MVAVPPLFASTGARLVAIAIVFFEMRIGFLSFTASLQQRVKAHQDCTFAVLGKMHAAGFDTPEQSPLSYVRGDGCLFDAH